eukprot:4442919-Amphidinium_carterae.1
MKVAALAGVMIVVVLHTFKWFSLTMLVAALLPKKYRAKWQLHRMQCRAELLKESLIVTSCLFPCCLGETLRKGISSVTCRKVPRCEVFVIVIVTVLANATNIAYAALNLVPTEAQRRQLGGLDKRMSV